MFPQSFGYQHFGDDAVIRQRRHRFEGCFVGDCENLEIFLGAFSRRGVVRKIRELPGLQHPSYQPGDKNTPEQYRLMIHRS